MAFKWLQTSEDCTALCAALNRSVMASSVNTLRSLGLKWRMKFRAFVGEHPEKFKTKMKDEVSSFNHHKDSSKSEIFRNPGAKIINQGKPFHICSHLKDNCNRKLDSNRWGHLSFNSLQSWLRLFYRPAIGHGQQRLPFQWNSFQTVPSGEGQWTS